MPIFTNISKLDAAKREIEHSIRLFFSYGDVVVIHLVSSASYKILSDLGRIVGITSARDQLYKRVKKGKVKYVRKKLDETYNFFKHADRDPSRLVKFSPESSEFIIWNSINIYQSLTKEITGLMMSFRVWFFLKNNDLLLKTEEKEYFKEAGNQIDINNRSLFLKTAEIFENKRTMGALKHEYE